MTPKIEIELLSSNTNCPVMIAPGRQFPGVLIQGDSLKCISILIEDIEQANADSDRSEIGSAILALKAKVDGYLKEYEATMETHGKCLPYVK